MHVYWPLITKPILQTLQPKVIVEIGSESGRTTQHLLKFCKQANAVLHSIDPRPLFDVAAMQRQFGAHFVLHQGLSLEALPTIKSYDAVLIDGDHNWYTVYHELKIIEQTCRKFSRTFPVVLLHDVGWPYGRRDLYYDPSTIPDQFRQPYARKGIALNSDTLVDQGGLNSGLCNAVTQGTPRNGVLTAVEDFLHEAQPSLELCFIPGFHGLGILFPSQLRQSNPQTAQVLDAWKIPAHVQQYVTTLEVARNALRVR